MNLITPIDCFTGYGITGYNIWKNLYNLDNNLALFLIGTGNIENGWDVDSLKKSVLNQIKFDKNKPCVKIWHSNDFITRTSGSSPYAGLSFFETDKISELETVNYNTLDTILAPSLWAKEILEWNGICKNTIVCPMGVDISIFNGDIPEDKTQDKYIFINIGKWEIRKGHDILVDIFNKAFNDNDNVELWMVNHNPFLNDEQSKFWIEKYKNSNLGNKIKIYPRLPSQQSLAKVMSYADCGIFPSRAEGWNNEAVEMMAMNKPIIITDYSAHTQYCDEDNAYLIDITNVVPAVDGLWFHGEGNWADISQQQIDQTVDYMRYVVKNNIRTNKNGLLTARSLSWNKTAEKIQEVLC